MKFCTLSSILILLSATCGCHKGGPANDASWRNGYNLGIDGEDYDYFIWDDEIEYRRFLHVQLAVDPSDILLKVIEKEDKCRVLSWRLIVPCDYLLYPGITTNGPRREIVRISKLEKKHFPEDCHDSLNLSDASLESYSISRAEADKLLQIK